jgi:hypothetical protein
VKEALRGSAEERAQAIGGGEEHDDRDLVDASDVFDRPLHADDLVPLQEAACLLSRVGLGQLRRTQVEARIEQRQRGFRVLAPGTDQTLDRLVGRRHAAAE